MIDKEFVLAGNAIFTVLNTATGKRYTFRVRQPDSNAPFFVQLLTGPENTRDYTYLGVLNLNGVLKLTGKSHYRDDSLPVRVFRQLLRVLWGDLELPAGWEVNHAGKCGRCGRLLTTPESCERGIGPECIKMMAGV